VSGVELGSPVGLVSPDDPTVDGLEDRRPVLDVLLPVLPNSPVLGEVIVPVLGADRLVLLLMLLLLLLPVGGRLDGPPGRTPVAGDAGGLILVSGLGDNVVGDPIELPELRRPDDEPSSGLEGLNPPGLGMQGCVD
jgi:hypothetical protein